MPALWQQATPFLGTTQAVCCRFHASREMRVLQHLA